MSTEFATAMELLLADRPSLDDVQQAAALLETASSQGHAEASERCALLDALGSARPPDWERSLDFLMRAAQQGSRLAQELICSFELALPTSWANLRVCSRSGKRLCSTLSSASNGKKGLRRARAKSKVISGSPVRLR